MRTVKCRSCQADIVWVKTANGNAMPIDASSAADGDTMYDKTRHVSHFATCPSAAQHRKPRKTAEQVKAEYEVASKLIPPNGVNMTLPPPVTEKLRPGDTVVVAERRYAVLEVVGEDLKLRPLDRCSQNDWDRMRERWEKTQ